MPKAGSEALIKTWSPVVIAALQDIGGQRWPPHQEKRGLLRRPKLIARFTVEGPLRSGSEILWAASHTLRPSVFDKRGSLIEGEREYWLVGLSCGESPCFRVEGAVQVRDIPARTDALKAALLEALAAGPKQDRFYGNRGPLSHRSRQGDAKK